MAVNDFCKSGGKGFGQIMAQPLDQVQPGIGHQFGNAFGTGLFQQGVVQAVDDTGRHLDDPCVLFN